MPKREIETHVVEFWPKPFKEVRDHEVPQSTSCDGAAEAVALEAKFHELGWPARAVTLQIRVERLLLTGK